MSRLFILIFASLFVWSSFAADQLIYVKCLDGGTKPDVLFDGYLKASSLKFESTLISIVGRRRELHKKQIENTKCTYTYQEQICPPYEGESCYWQDVKRNWNAIEARVRPSTTYLNCNVTSLVEVFDHAEGWLQDVKDQFVAKNRVTENLVSDRSCVIPGADIVGTQGR